MAEEKKVKSKLTEAIEKSEDFLRKELELVKTEISQRITIERDSLREAIGQVKRIEPNKILGDIQNIKDQIFQIRDQLNDILIFKAEKLEKDVEKYNIEHTTGEMREMYKKSGATLKLISETFHTDISVISKLINKKDGNALLRHKVYLYLIQEAHKNIKEMEHEPSGTVA